MRCLVTAGPTWEPIDGARRLTNFSTGSLGGTLANHLAAAGHEVTLLLAESAIWRSPLAAVTVQVFHSTASLSALLESHATSERVAVFHAAAVSDFRVAGAFVKGPSGELESVQSGKFSTRSGNLWLELTPTPKIIARLREWYPCGLLFGWKYEVDGDRTAVLAAASEQLACTGVDSCVVNGPAYGPGFGILTPDSRLEHLAGNRELLVALTARIG